MKHKYWYYFFFFIKIYKIYTVIRLPLNVSLSLSRASTIRFISRCNRLPKSLNIVEPPDNTILLYNGLLTSIGQFWITSSTISLNGVVKSGLEN